MALVRGAGRAEVGCRQCASAGWMVSNQRDRDDIVVVAVVECRLVCSITRVSPIDTVHSY